MYVMIIGFTFRDMTKGETVNGKKNADLSDKSG